MSLRRSWPGSVSSFALAVALVAAGPAARAAAQDTWQKAYSDGERAFTHNDYVTAEQKFRYAIANNPSKNRGPKVLVISQQRGFIPEYYLAIICAETKPEEALKFAGIAGTYLESKEQIDTLKAAEAKATQVLRSVQTGSVPVPPTGRDTKPAVDPSAQAVKDIRAALSTGQLDAAVQLRDQARANGAKGSEFDDVSHTVDQRVDQKTFDTAMSAATQALAANRFSEAAQQAQRARQTGIDPGRVTAFEADLSRQQQAAAGSGVASRTTTEATPSGRSMPSRPSPAVVDAERRGLRALLSGDYQVAMAVLQASALDVDGQRARFYLACAEAGQALMEPDPAKRSNLQAEARQDWQAVAASRPSFAADLRYISPAILRTLGIAQD
jgi:hypothetical protein